MHRVREQGLVVACVSVTLTAAKMGGAQIHYPLCIRDNQPSTICFRRLTSKHRLLSTVKSVWPGAIPSEMTIGNVKRQGKGQGRSPKKETLNITKLPHWQTH